jgi:hypothetical protein
MINENDGIGKCGLDNSFFNLDPLINRDHATFDKILIPGINRYQIPEEAPITKNERNAEDTYRHSFITCSIPEFKRRLMLKKFIDMM